MPDQPRTAIVTSPLVHKGLALPRSSAKCPENFWDWQG
jgi:hypothetical protein